MDFVWNRTLAEEVREATSRAIDEQSGNMQEAARQLLEQASNIESTSIPPLLESLADAETASSRASIQRSIDTTRARINLLRASARRLSSEAYELDSRKRAANQMFEEMWRMARETDDRYAAQMQALQADINRYMARIQELRDSMGIVAPGGGACIGAILNNPTHFAEQWADIQNVLSRPADQITSRQFETLAWWFSLQTSIGGQERFLNYLADPVRLPSDVAVLRGDFTAFTFCPQKVAGIQWYIQGGIGALLGMQMNFATDSDAHGAIQAQRDHLKGLSVLLTVVNSLTEHGVRIVTWDEATTPGVQQRVLLGINNAPPIRLSEGYPNGTAVTFTRGEVFTKVEGEGINHNTARGFVSLQPSQLNHRIFRASEIIDSTITISTRVSGVTLNSENTRALGDHFYQRHQFDLAEHIAMGILGLYGSVLTTPIPDAASISLDLAMVFASIPAASAEARGIQNDFRTFESSVLLGAYNERFHLRGVLVTEDGRLPEIISWPTVATESSLNALNSVAGTNFTWEDYLRNPNAVMEAFDGVRWTDFCDFDRIARANYNSRNNDVREQVTSPTVQPRIERPQPQLPNPSPSPPSNLPPGSIEYMET